MKSVNFTGIRVLCLLLLLPCFLQGQDVKTITARMETIFKDMPVSERKGLIEGYVGMLNSGVLTQSEKMETDSLFLDLKTLGVTVQPELKSYVQVVGHCCRGGKEGNLRIWLRGLEKIMNTQERRRTLVKVYLEQSVPLILEQLVFSGSNHRWQVRGELTWKEGETISVEFSGADLLCTTRKDSICIYGTNGRWQLGETELTINGGQVKWKIGSDDLHAELRKCRISLKGSEYTADSVAFYYPAKYNRSLCGQLKDNALKYTRGKDTPFPEFLSSDMDVEIRDIYKNIHYVGGVCYTGSKFSGIGKEEVPAVLKIVPNDTISMNIYARRFNFDSLRVMAGQSKMEIVMDSGTITHTDVHFLYTEAQHSVVIKRISEQSAYLPFKDTYHQILFDVDEIYWPLDSTYMQMRMASRSGLYKAKIESINFFNDQVYDRIQGLDEIHPLNGLLKCSQELQSNVFTVGDYAGFMKKPADQLRKQIVLLSYNDFVDFNERKDEVHLKQRLFDYTKARVGKQDYDNIRFVSQPGKSRLSALLDVRNFGFRIFGVEQFVISEARNIFAVPSDGEILMLKNRDMEFNGLLNAGMFDMYGRKLFFSYDKYRIVLPSVDSAQIYIAGNDQKKRMKRVESIMRDITGEIVIDKPNNKSGQKEDSGYPILKSTKDSYVYFQHPQVQGGQYKQDSFYYKVDPYTIQGINDAKSLNYAFSGTLVSNIVSPIKDTLRLQDDNTLGINYEIPKKGIELYGKGKIYDRLTLNKHGFTARGKVVMNRSEFASDSILLLPKRMLAQTEVINVQKIKGLRPGVKGREVAVEYLKSTGNLRATSDTIPFKMYGSRVKHNGSLMVYEERLEATGKLEVEGAVLQSALFNLCDTNVISPKANFAITSKQNAQLCLSVSQIATDIDLAANKGRFGKEAQRNRMEFAGSRYVCGFEQMEWDMKKACLNIGLNDSVRASALGTVEDVRQLPAVAKNEFVSGKRDADSLRFIAPSARYVIDSGSIACRGVNHIDVANGRFFPIGGEVFIQGDGEIRKFFGGRLLCERRDTTKMLREVDFNLKGLYRFSGSGKYDYISEEKKRSELTFGEIGVDSMKRIRALAKIPEDRLLLLNDGLNFKGRITLFSDRADLHFDGYTGLVFKHDSLQHSMVKVKDFLASRRIVIPVKTENQDEKQQRNYNGIFLNTDKSIQPYAAFLSKRRFYNDDLLMGGEGKMIWSPGLKRYMISDTASGKNQMLWYDPEESVVSGHGVIQLELKLPGLKQKTIGDIRYGLQDKALKMDKMLYCVDFVLLDKMNEIVLNDLSEKKSKEVAFTNELKEKIGEMSGKKTLAVMDKQIKNGGFSLPDSLNRQWVFDALELKWNPKLRSYVADCNVDVVAFKGKVVGRNMNIKMELQRNRSKSQYFMYIYDDNVWYYFEFADESLYTLSSNQEYNQIVKNEKAEKKVIMDSEKEVQYTITLCPDSKVERFLSRVK